MQSSPDEGGGSWLRSKVLDLVNGASEALGFSPRLLTRGAIDNAVDERTGEHLLAVLRELLSNVSRHAGATAVDVEVAVEDGSVTLRVRDDGCGAPEGAARSGLCNASARAEELSGSLSVVSEPGQGALVEWSVRRPQADCSMDNRTA